MDLSVFEELMVKILKNCQTGQGESNFGQMMEEPNRNKITA